MYFAASRSRWHKLHSAQHPVIHREASMLFLSGRLWEHQIPDDGHLVGTLMSLGLELGVSLTRERRFLRDDNRRPRGGIP